MRVGSADEYVLFRLLVPLTLLQWDCCKTIVLEAVPVSRVELHAGYAVSSVGEGRRLSCNHPHCQGRGVISADIKGRIKLDFSFSRVEGSMHA